MEGKASVISAKHCVRVMGVLLSTACLRVQAGEKHEVRKVDQVSYFASDARVMSIDANGRLIPTIQRTSSTIGHSSASASTALTNGSFDDDLASWVATTLGGNTIPGEIRVQNGRAVLLEGDSFLITLSQTFTVTTPLASLSFEIFFDPGFDLAENFIPDAFEASLLDENFESVVPTWHPLATSLFNVQEDLTVNKGPSVIFDGQKVTVDLMGVPVGTQVTLYFDLIGADDDYAGGISIDNVSTTPVRQSPYCGDGVLDPGEECEVTIPCFSHDKPCKETICNDECRCIKVNLPTGTIVPTYEECMDLRCVNGLPFEHPKPQGHSCGVPVSQGPCDLPDTCNGWGSCDWNRKEAHVVCREAVDECDAPEYCSGLAASCPPDLCAPPGTLAPDDANECTYDVCDGRCNAIHPTKRWGMPCGDAKPDGPCDLPDRCDGNGTCEANTILFGEECATARTREFVECLTGPATGTLSPSCVWSDFDEDRDVDLLDMQTFLQDE